MTMLTQLIQRLLILGLGVRCVWLIVFVMFGFVDHRLLWILAVSATYGLAAYVVLPRAVHMGLRVLQRKHVPAFAVNGDGLPGDPVNIVLIGTLKHNATQHARRALGVRPLARRDARSSPTTRQPQLVATTRR